MRKAMVLLVSLMAGMAFAAEGEHAAPQSTRDARFSGGIVYRYGGAIDFDSVAASVAGDRATVARWAPGDDSDVGESLETAWVR